MSGVADATSGVLDGMHIGANWRIWLNPSCAVVVQPCARLLWPAVITVIYCYT